MESTLSIHAEHRAQQRGVPPLVIDWLISFGQETFDGRGAIVRYFDQRAIRRLEREVGQAPVRRMSEFMRCYLVQSTGNGHVITVGKRHRGKRIPRH
jgi:hypothetical protein